MIRLLQRHLIAWSALNPALSDPLDYGTRGDGRRDDDGAMGPRTRAALAAALPGRTLSRVGDQIALLRREISHRGALGPRALAVSLREWLDEVREVPMGSNGGPRIGEYFAACYRADRPVRMRAGAWCAAAASWATKAAACAYEWPPHGYRISGAELQADLREAGAWVPIEHVRSGRYMPAAGDLVILTRGSGWTRHVCRLVAMRGEYLWTLGGNEGGEWRLTPRRIGDTRLLGLGDYGT